MDSDDEELERLYGMGKNRNAELSTKPIKEDSVSEGSDDDGNGFIDIKAIKKISQI